MGKDSNKHLVGQPILQQILDLVPRVVFDKLVFEHASDRYYKTFDAWTHFVTIQLTILSRCDSTTEIASGMQGKLSLGDFGFIYFVDWDQIRERKRVCEVQIMGE